MALDELGIVLRAKIGNTSSDISDLNKQIEQIQSKLNQVNIGVKLADNIQKSFTQIEQQAKSAGKSIQDSFSQTLSDKGFKSFTTSMEKTLDEIKTKFQGTFDTLKTTTMFSGEEKALQSFIVQLENAAGKITKLKYQIDTSQPMIGKSYPTTLVSTTEVDNTDKIAQQQLANAQKLSAQQYQQWWTMALKQQDAEQKFAQDYEQFWLKALKSRDLTEQQTIEKQQQIEQKAADNYEQWWLKSLKNVEMQEQAMVDQIESYRLKSIAKREQAEREADTAQLQAIQKNMDLERQAQEQESQRVASLGSVKTTVNPTVFAQSGSDQTSALKQYITQAYAAETTDKELEKAQISLSSAFNSAGNEVLKYSIQFKDAEGNVKQFQGTFDQATSAMYQNSQKFTQAQEKLTGFKEAIANFGKQALQMPIWMASWSAIMLPMDAMNSIINTIKTVDTQMTSLKRVMATGTDFNSMLQKSIQMSNQLGVSLNDVLTVENEFGRQGFSSTDTLSLTKVTTLLQNISDLQPQEAMTAITAGMKNFNISAQDSITIANKLNNIDNNFSASTSTLADSMTKAAATAKTYGVSLDDLLGMTTAVSETTKESGTVIGNSLKTIFSRLETSNSSVKALQGLGISVTDATGKMKSATTVLGELAGEWNNLTSSQQQNAAVSIAGRYQLTRFLALMQDWKTVVNASSYALNSQNSAINENAKYQESLQARINRLETAWKQLSLTIGNEVLTNTFIGVVSGLKDIVTALDPVIKNFGLLPPIITAVGLAMVTFNKNFRDTMDGNFTSFFVKAKSGFTSLRTSITEVGLAETALATKTRVVEATMAGLKTLGSTLMGIGSALLPFVAISAATYGIEKLIQYISKLRQEQQQEQQQMDQSVRSYQGQSQQIDKMVTEYTKLESVKNSTGLNNAQQKEYLSIQQKLANVLPIVVTGTDAQGKSIVENSKALKANIDLLKQKLQLDHDQAISGADSTRQQSQDKIDNINAQIGQKQKEAANLQSDIKKYEDELANPQLSSTAKSKADYGLSGAVSQLNAVQKQILSLKNQIDTANNSVSKEASNILNIYKDLSTSDINWLSNLYTKGKVSSKELDSLGQTIESLRSKLGKSLPSNFFDNMSVNEIKTISNLSNEYDNGQISIEQFTKTLQNSGLTTTQVSDILDGLTKAQDNNTKGTKQQTDAQKTLQDILKGTQKTEEVLMKTILGYDQTDVANKKTLITVYNSLANIKNKNNQEDALYKATVEQLIKLFPSLVNGHEVNIKAIESEVQAQQILADAITKEANGQLNAEQTATLNKILNTNKRIDAMKNEIAAMQTLQNAYDATTKAVEKMLTGSDAAMALASGDVAKWNTIAMQQEQLLKSTGAVNLGSYESQLKALESANSTAVTKLGKSIGDINVTSGSSKSGKSGSKSGGSGSSSSAANDAKQKAQDLANSIVQIYKDMYQKEEDIATASIQKQMDALDAQHQKVLDNLSAEDKAYQDSVNKKLALIDKQTNAQQYNDTLKQQQQAVQADQNKINVLKLDNSPEGKAALAAAQQQLASDQKTLNDTQSQHTTDLRKQNLQDDLSAYQQDIQNQQDAETKKYNDQKAALQKQQDQVKAYYDNLINDQRKFNQITSDALKGNFTSIKKDFSSFADFIKKNMSDIGQSISENLLDNMTNAEKSMNSVGSKSSTSSSKTSSSSGSKTSSTKYYTVQSGDTLSKIAQKEYGHSTATYYDKIASANGISPSASLKVGERLKIPSLATGGVVSVPTLIQAGDAGVGNPEIFAPKKLMTSIVTDGLSSALKQFAMNQADKVKNLGNTINMPITIQNLSGGKEGADQLFTIVSNKLKIMGVN